VGRGGMAGCAEGRSGVDWVDGEQVWTQGRHGAVVTHAGRHACRLKISMRTLCIRCVRA
jgi:hypothetical protein